MIVSIESKYCSEAKKVCIFLQSILLLAICTHFGSSLRVPISLCNHPKYIYRERERILKKHLGVIVVQELTAEVEVRAAHNVLEACAQTSTVDKVVFTSSATAVIWRDGRNTMPDLDERNWSDISFCKKYKVHPVS